MCTVTGIITRPGTGAATHNCRDGGVNTRPTAASFAQKSLNIQQDDLLVVAIHDTDFLGDLRDDDTLPDVVAAAVSLAAEIWLDRSVGAIPPHMLAAARAELQAQARAIFTDALADAIEAGDRDVDGEPIPYPRSY
jgi:hypothetical protein